MPFTERVYNEHGKNIEFVALEDLKTGCSFCAVFGAVNMTGVKMLPGG
jgi:hypothetical protein